MTEWQGLPIPQLDGFTGFVPPDGDGTYGVALIGEAPGEQEIRYGKPFYENAPAGAVLKRLLSRAGLDRGKFIISNAVWSRPPGNYLDGSQMEGRAIAAYQPFRDQLFEHYRPRVFVALGGVALRTLSHYGGRGATISNVQGYVLEGPYSGTWVIGALHPSAIMRGEQRMSGVVIWALQKAIDIARNGFVRLPTRYVTHPSLDDALAFERNYHADTHFLSYDIETAESSSLDEEQVEEKDEDISYNITRISFCYEAPSGYAISLPWQEPFVGIAKRLLSSSGRKRVWNGNFDNPRLTAAHAPVNGRIYDSMWAWKFLQPTLPRSLGFVAPFYNWTGEPWKSTSDSEPESYSCKDAHALQLIADGVDEHLRQKGQWHVYERHVVELGEVLSKMSENGLPYDQAKADAFSLELKAKWDERFAELQRCVPDELKPSKQKTGYVKVPKELDGLVQREFPVLNKETMEITRELRWCKLEPFLPTSHVQVKELIKHFGHSVGKARKTKNDTADDETLKKLLKKTRASKKPRDKELGELLQTIRECRQLSKVQGTYVKGWKPGRDGRIHATPGHWGKMFRVSWRRPNISATIQDKQEEYIASGFRKCVATRAGSVLLESDWKGIEAVLVGWFANDPDYMRLARLGVHDYMGIYMAGGTVDLTLSDDALRSMFKAFKREFPKLRDDAKHTVHGTNYGMGARLMSDMYEMPEREAKRLQGLYFDLFPKVRAWQRSVLDRASRECKLRNPFGYCVTPDMKVLTAELLWKSAGDLTVEDRLLAFDEYAPEGRRARQYRFSEVLQAQPADVETVEVELSNGDRVVTTPDHKWLAVRYPDSKYEWIQSQQLKQGQRVTKALNTWQTLDDREAGWLAGIFDGEGSLSYTGIGESAGMLALAQNPGIVLETIKRLLTQFGFSYKESGRINECCKSLTVNGGLANRLRFLGSVRPIRLLAKALQSSFGEVQSIEDVRVVNVAPCGVRAVTILTTSTQTFFADGYAMHNCMPFWEVYRWDSKSQRYVMGEDAKSAIAFLPRDTAAAMLKEVLLRLRYLADEHVMLCSTHDSITCEVEEADLYRVARIIKTEMERGVPELDQLQIGVELKAGGAWHESSMQTLELLDTPTSVIAQEATSHHATGPDSLTLPLPAG